MSAINIPTYMAFGYYASLFPSQNTKLKTILVIFLSHNSDFYIGIVSLYLAIQTLSDFWDTVNSQLQEKNIWDNITMTLYPLSSMLEIIFEQWKHKHISTPFSYLFLNVCFSLSLSNSVVLHPQNQFKEVFFTLWCCWCNGKSFNTWVFLQLRPKSAISKYFTDRLLKNAYHLLQYFSILLSCCCCRSRSFIQYLTFGTLGLHFLHAVFKHL